MTKFKIKIKSHRYNSMILITFFIHFCIVIIWFNYIYFKLQCNEQIKIISVMDENSKIDGC